MHRCLAYALTVTLALTTQARAACDADPGRITLTGDGTVTPMAVQAVTPRLDLNGVPVVGIIFCPEGAKVLAEITAASIGKKLHLRVDGESVISAIVMDTISGGEMTVTGTFDLAETEALATRLRQAAGLTE